MRASSRRWPVAARRVKFPPFGGEGTQRGHHSIPLPRFSNGRPGTAVFKTASQGTLATRRDVRRRAEEREGRTGERGPTCVLPGSGPFTCSPRRCDEGRGSGSVPSPASQEQASIFQENGMPSVGAVEYFPGKRNAYGGAVLFDMNQRAEYLKAACAHSRGNPFKAGAPLEQNTRRIGENTGVRRGAVLCAWDGEGWQEVSRRSGAGGGLFVRHLRHRGLMSGHQPAVQTSLTRLSVIRCPAITDRRSQSKFQC